MAREEQEKAGILSPADEISLKSVLIKFGDTRRYLITKWRIIFMAVAIGAVLGLLNSILSKITYTAECTFVLEENEKGGSGLGQYSSLAAIAGIDVSSGGGLFQGDNITQLYKSRLMLRKTLFTPAKFDGKQELLINRYIKINKLKTAWKGNEKLKDLNFNALDSNFTIVQDSVINLIVSDINKNYLVVDKPDKKLSLVSVKVNAKDQLFAKNFTEAIVSNVNTFYVQTKTKRALQNVQLLSYQADSVHRVLSSSIGRAAAAYDANPNPDPSNTQQLRAPAQKKQVDVQAATAIYSEVVRNLEIARAALQRETPLIQVIDEPMLPLVNDRVGKLRSMLTGAGVAFLIAVLALFSMRLYRGVMD